MINIKSEVKIIEDREALDVGQFYHDFLPRIFLYFFNVISCFYVVCVLAFSIFFFQQSLNIFGEKLSRPMPS